MTRNYILDEKIISKKIKSKVNYPIRVFNLNGIGINQAKFIKDMKKSFKNLPWDFYDVRREQINFLIKKIPSEKKILEKFFPHYYLGKTNLSQIESILKKLSKKDRNIFNKIKPYRRRSMASFVLSYSQGRWNIKKIKKEIFSQKVRKDDYRSLTRVFQEMSTSITKNPEFEKLLTNIAEMVREDNSNVKKLNIECHQTKIIALENSAGDNSPEGVHKDGCDYIVSALVIERKGIKGGISKVYSDDKKKEYLKIKLEPGEGIFQKDAWHDVTKIYAQSRKKMGVRNIFGFDISIQ